MAPFRDAIATRAARASELRAAIACARRELDGLDREADALSRRWGEVGRWCAAGPAPARFRLGAGLGAAFVFLTPLFLITLMAASGSPALVHFIAGP